MEVVDRLVIACQALGLVVKEQNSLRNAHDVERYMVRTGRHYFGDFLAYEFSRQYAEWASVSEWLHGSGRPKQDSFYLDLMRNPGEARKFTLAGFESALSLAHLLTRIFDFTQHRKWLDFAGGSGVYSIVACEKMPALESLVLDQVNVIPVTREMIAKHGLEDRIQAEVGDFRSPKDYPTGYDLISFITPLQGYMPDEIQQFFGYAFEALEAGGEILVIDYMLEDDKTGPLDAALMNLSQVVDGHCTGRVNSGLEFSRLLDQAGFESIELQWLISHQLGKITARKATGYTT